MPSFSLIQESKDEAHGDAANVAGNVELPVEPVEALGAGNVELRVEPVEALGAGNVELRVEPVEQLGAGNVELAEPLGAGNVEMAGDVKDCVDKLIHKQFV